MKREVVQVGDKTLRLQAKPVPKKDFGTSALKKLIKTMSDTLKDEEFGVAIAAPQIGESLRIFVVAGKVFVEKDEPEKSVADHPGSARRGQQQTPPTPADRVFINPTITKLSKKKKKMSEGCLSVRGTYGTVMRHERATVKAYDETGKPFTYNGAGLVGHIFQHEVDHLDGILFIDKAIQIDDDKSSE